MTKKIVAVQCALLAFTVMAGAQEGGTRIAAKYISSLGGAGSPVELLQPQQIRLDQHRQEIYICDTGNNRILIMDQRGNLIYEFSRPDILSAPTDVAVDREGKIYVLGSPSGGSYLHIFDYNGEYLGPYLFSDGPAADSVESVSMALDSSGMFYFLDGMQGRVLKYDLQGGFHGEFPIFPETEVKLRRDMILGGLYLIDNQVCIPAPLAGSVLCFDVNGTLLRMIGHTGGSYGELSFPVAVARDNCGDMLVLDKHRNVIVVFDSKGMIQGEIGGMGDGPGWFYHPIAMLVDNHNRLWVAQGLKNLVQVLQLPSAGEPASPAQEAPVVVDD